MWQSILIVGVGISMVLGARRLVGWLVRRRGLHRLDGSEILRQTRGVRIAGLLHRLPPHRGMNPRRRNIMKGDLAMSADRFLLVSNRGLLVDVGPERGTKFTSVRCTGPGRLVLESELPSPLGGMGQIRYEISLDNADAWAEALQLFVKETEGGKYFATKPPWL